MGLGWGLRMVLLVTLRSRFEYIWLRSGLALVIVQLSLDWDSRNIYSRWRVSSSANSPLALVSLPVATHGDRFRVRAVVSRHMELECEQLQRVLDIYREKEFVFDIFKNFVLWICGPCRMLKRFCFLSRLIKKLSSRVRGPLCRI